VSRIVSVNLAVPRPDPANTRARTGIDKRPTSDPVPVVAPGAKGMGALVGDTVASERHHGGPDQALYAYAREDMDEWAAELGRPLSGGMFGENLTTAGLDVTGALIGERWRVGPEVELEVSGPRIPCDTFAGWMGEPRWVKRFTARAKPGAYLRVVTPGQLRAGDPVGVVYRPGHEVTIGLTFRALTLAPELLPRLLTADALSAKLRESVLRRTGRAQR
jgi:MOSC domain-containing protein YiiM